MRVCHDTVTFIMIGLVQICHADHVDICQQDSVLPQSEFSIPTDGAATTLTSGLDLSIVAIQVLNLPALARM